MSHAVRVSCRLRSPLDGEPPHLDALLQLTVGNASGMVQQRALVTASLPLPPPIPIPLCYRWAGTVEVPCCSSPIVAARAETVERFEKHIDAHLAHLVAEDDRRVITATSKGWMKRYWRPHRIRAAPAVVWFCTTTDLDCLRTLLDSVRAVGRQIASGYGAVASWSVEPVADDWSWFAPWEDRLVLMRPLPWSHTSTDFFHGRVTLWQLPTNLLGYSRHFGACVAPYWHPTRQMEVVVPS